MIAFEELLDFIERRMPFYLQEDWDRSGVWYNAIKEISTVALGLEIEDFTHEDLDRADTFVVHHPPFLRENLPLPPQKEELLAHLRNRNLIVCHTNADFARNSFVDYVLRNLGIKETRPALPKTVVRFKVVTFVPEEAAAAVLNEIIKQGFGRIGFYDGCSFAVTGKGYFKPVKGARPYSGNVGAYEENEEVKIEFEVDPKHLEAALDAVEKVHPYEEPVIEVYEMKRLYSGGGAGRIFESELSLEELVSKFDKIGILVSGFSNAKEKAGKTVFLPGSGRNFVKDVVKFCADTFISGDLGYHEKKDLQQFKVNFIEIEHGSVEVFFVDWLAVELKSYFGSNIKLLSRRER